MARRSGLGKGLSALIPTEVTGDRTSALREVPIGNIKPNPRQPRTSFDEETMSSLAASIKELGVLQPVLVRRIGDETSDEFELIAGERRWRASRRAGLHTIPVLIQTSDDTHSLEQALVENLHRQDLNVLEEAAAYQQLIEEFGFTHDQVATRVGKSRTAVTNILRLLQLPSGVQRLLAEGQISPGHARALLGTPDRGYQEVAGPDGGGRRPDRAGHRGSGPRAQRRSGGGCPQRPEAEGAAPLPVAGVAGATPRSRRRPARGSRPRRHRPGRGSSLPRESSNWRNSWPATSTPG